jgi:hypothetical protein
MKIKDPRIVEEFKRQKRLLNPEWTDEDFLAYILEARARVLAQMTINQIKEDLQGEEK